jgi:thioesterase domain-containing protein
MLVVQPHGLGNAPIPGTIEAMAEDRVKALKAVRPHGPYMVGGYCNGAFVAFEMARQLVAQGDDVPVVIVIEARAPREVASDAGTGGEAYISFDRDGGIRKLAPRDRAADAQLRYSQAMDRYVGGRYPGHLVFIRPGKLDGAERDVGWARFAESSEIHVLPGDHVTLVTHHIDELAQAIRGAILRVRERVVP